MISGPQRPLPAQHTTNTRDERPCLSGIRTRDTSNQAPRRSTPEIAGPPESAHLLMSPVILKLSIPCICRMVIVSLIYQQHARNKLSTLCYMFRHLLLHLQGELYYQNRFKAIRFCEIVYWQLHVATTHGTFTCQ
jgi:hypothetical protein